ncbi:MAG: sulfite exporter TauE/SafE family protein [Yoonia sp.]|uniref:sulfite exporter TauE/SafE family protein n=1 Tax=Yoonia sp. TaxID=2212373 RepID=UPI003263FD7B
MFAFDQFAFLIAVVFIFAGSVKGLVGIGMPTVSIGIMSQFSPPHFAIAVVVFPMLVANIWQVYRTGVGLDTLRRYKVLVAFMVVSLMITTFFTAKVPPDFLIGVIGVAIVIFAVTSLARTPPALPDHRDGVGQVITGIAAGVLGGFTSIWSPPLVTYLIARRVEAEEFVRAAGVLILIGTVPLIVGFWQTGLLNGETAPMSIMMIVPTLIGFTIGEAIRRRMDPAKFRQVILWLFLLMGINLLRRAFF